MKTFPLSQDRPTSVNTSAERRHRPLGMILLYLVTFAILAGFFVYGYSYYLTPYSERPHHAEYRQLRPAGTLGLAFGIVGSVMMIVMLSYSVRKRSKSLRRAGPLPTWLNMHIYLGIAGPLFIVLHTSFRVQGLVAVSFWSMVVVALSGYFGRYLYIQIPRNIQGNELDLQELRELGHSLTIRLKDNYNLDEKTLARLDNLAPAPIPESVGVFRALLITFWNDLNGMAAMRRLKREFSMVIDLPKSQMRQLMNLTHERLMLQRRISLLGRVQRLFHYWHVIHKPFAIVMYIVMAIHIGVAIWTGYARIF